MIDRTRCSASTSAGPWSGCAGDDGGMPFFLDYSEPVSQPATPRAAVSAGTFRNLRFRVGAVIVLAVIGGLILWLALRNGGASAKGVSVAEIRTLAASVGHPIFWVGPQKGYTYELKRNSDGSIYIRYLPQGVKPGSNAQYLTVATYPFEGAYAAVENVLKQGGATRIRLAHKGLAEFSTTNPNNVHAAYPGIDYQAEIFDPNGGAAAIVREGRLAAFGGPSGSAAPKPIAASPAKLRSLVTRLGRPIYWAGPRSGYTYELRRTLDRKVYIRYLPPGVPVASRRSYLTVATYPFPGAFAAIQRTAKRKHQVRIGLAGGGLGVMDARNPNNVHLAYPGSDYQVEVFDPSGRARRIATSGRITAIG